MKRFLIIQIRPEDETADNELEAFMKFGGIEPDEIHRVQAERAAIPKLDVTNYAAVIVGGGPSNFSDKNKSDNTIRMEADIMRVVEQVITHDVPFLGACYGFSALVCALQGVVSKEKYSETVGATTIRLTSEGLSDPLTKNLPASFRAFGGHKEACQMLPKDAVCLADSETCPVQMIRYKHNVYATQFHPELDTDGLILRINIYKHAGYFPPEDAELLIAAGRREEVTIPQQILQNFVENARRLAD
jgi:GMP synthase (glutamine-hydrolysing)